MDWRGKGIRLEEGKECKYLGYILQRNRGQEAHVRDSRRRAVVAMKEV